MLVPIKNTRVMASNTLCSSQSPHLNNEWSPKAQNNDWSPDALKEDIILMREKLQIAEIEITRLTQEGCQEDELKIHMEKLHNYNEVKDTGQMLLGRMATIEGVRTKDMYEKYSLDLED